MASPNCERIAKGRSEILLFGDFIFMAAKLSSWGTGGMAECPKCGGEMREGEVLIRVTIPLGQVSPGLSLGTGMPGMGIQTGETTSEEHVLWREKTGRRTGWLIKSEEENIIKVSGRRCLNCGYIELYANR